MWNRIVQTLTFRSLGSSVYAKPDLFNPLWIDVTLAFVLTIVGNVNKYFYTPGDFHFNFGVVQKSFSLVFGLAVLVPFLITVCFFVYGMKPTVSSTVGIVAIYNYSNVFFVIGAAFYLIPMKLVGFLFLLAFALLSALSLIVNYGGFIEQYNDQRKKVVIIGVLVIQAMAMLVYKFGFFV